MAQAIVLMGVSGSGKTAVGKSLSDSLNWPFFDGDDFMPENNIKKMSRGIPLNDEDRKSWLEALSRVIKNHLGQGQSLIVASSALKQLYRETLRGDLEGVIFVYLKGSYELISARMDSRRGHFMKANMLRSQFQTLEEPQNAVTINVDQSISAVVEEIIKRINL